MFLKNNEKSLESAINEMICIQTLSWCTAFILNTKEDDGRDIYLKPRSLCLLFRLYIMYYLSVEREHAEALGIWDTG